MRFRFHLLGFAAATTLPLLVLALVLAMRTAADQRAGLERQARDIAGALQLSVDRELGSVLASVTVLGTSPAVDAALAAPAETGATLPFLDQARSLLAARPVNIQALVLYDHQGRQIANSQRPAGTPLPNVGMMRAPGAGRDDGRATFAAALADGRPRITALFWAPVPRRYMIGFIVPVVRDGRAIGAVAGNIPPESISRVLAEQMLPPGWLAGVADDRGRIVGRSEGARFIGQPSPNGHVRPGGFLRTTTIDGRAVYVAARLLRVAPWRVGCSVPAAQVEQALPHTLAPLALGGAILVLLSLAGALIIGRRMGAEVEALGRLEAGDGSRIAEVASAQRALATAAAEARARLAERQREVEHERLLGAELSHRVKNALAVVQSMLLQTRRGAASIDGFVRDLQGRLAAYATAHDLLLASNWRDVDLGMLVRAELAPYLDDGGAVTIDGPPLPLDGRRGVALALILHELATNAAKYGALSVTPPLALAIDWTVMPLPDGGRVVLRWQEQTPGVPSLAAPGFGTRLIRQSATHDLKGEAELRIDSTRLCWTLRFTLTGVAEPAGRLAA